MIVKTQCSLFSFNSIFQINNIRLLQSKQTPCDYLIIISIYSVPTISRNFVNTVN